MLKGMVSLVTGGASGLGKATVERLIRKGGKVVIMDIQGTRAQEFVKDLGDDAALSVGDGMVSLVTGGASGLGKATVERLIRKGGKVVIMDIQGTRAQEFVKDLGDDAALSVGDVSSEEDIKKAITIVQEKFGRLDTLVNCAGFAMTLQVYNFNKDKPGFVRGIQKCVEVNTIGTFNAIRLAAGVMGKNEPDSNGQRGVIVNTAGTIAYDGDKGQAPYAASAAAVIGMTLPIARELASQGIRVVTIAPGMFWSPLISYLPEKIIEYIQRMTAFPARLGKPAEFAHMVTSIVENPMLNGEVIRLDGAYRCFPINNSLVLD